ncbi:hypothetical protein AVEN_139350-1 [Araneus ventricosus]|uniref:Uncharacterized protein n=1 Tax=Araneus ventricosus TaxID=182803 RepID=A0A4Y1ZQI3_ARAVE|nr:hypothetical protein AVEN_230277-1 [Araneus ventricosus]GBM51779.1 hypothetical protein AVEN_139350-1 [Araneus ventricosus]
MRIGLLWSKDWKSNIIRFPFGAFGHKTEIRSMRRGASLSHKSEKPPVGGGEDGGYHVMRAVGGVAGIAATGSAFWCLRE